MVLDKLNNFRINEQNSPFNPFALVEKPAVTQAPIQITEDKGHAERKMLEEKGEIRDGSFGLKQLVLHRGVQV